MNDYAYQYLLEIRGVDVPCTKCRGTGVNVYGSTSTWRGGIGGAAMTTDVCASCWGTGDAHRHGVNLKELTSELKDLRHRVAQQEKKLAKLNKNKH